MGFESDYADHAVELMVTALRRASRRFAEGAPADESLGVIDDALAAAVEMPAPLFLRMSPQSMVSLLEISAADDRLVAKIADALLLEADVFETEGMLIEAGVRREQAAAMLEFIDPARAN